MKKILSGMLISLFSISALSGCGNQNSINTMQLQTTIPANQNNVSIQSNKGLAEYYRFQARRTFQGLDTNKDSKLTIKEYLPHMNFSEPTTEELQRFVKVDKNKDNSISLDEAVNNKYFLFQSLSEMREATKKVFDRTDVNKDNSVTKQEMIDDIKKTYIKVDSNFISMVLLIFNSYDLNNDQVLSFSEYEDIMYKGAISSNETWDFVNKPQDPVNPAPDPGNNTTEPRMSR